MLTFLYPAFLIGAAAAAIPVLLHLLRDHQAPEIRFSAVRLLRGVRVEQAQRRRIRDWLLLALRVAALLLLALAFARPYFASERERGGRGAVIVLDRSASMSVPAVWARARNAAFNAIDRAAVGEPVGLIAFDDRPELIAEPTPDRSALKSAVERIRPGVGGTRYAAALARAVSVLDEATAGGGRVILISDLQGTPGDARTTIPDSVSLEVVGTSAPFDNVALLGVMRTADGIAATVRNDGAAPRRLRVSVESGGSRVSGTAVDVPPAQTVETLVAAPVGRGEVRVALADAGADAVAADNARFLSLEEAQPTRVLVVGDAEESFYVDAALRAAGSRPEFAVVTATAHGVVAALSGKPAPEVMFLVGGRSVDRGGRDALLRFAHAGGGVFIAATGGVNEPGYASLLPGLQLSVPRGDDALLSMGAFEGRHPVFRSLGMMSDGLSGARFTRAWRVTAEGWQVLARFDDGAGALYERTEGSGRIVFFASDVNRAWNDLPVQSAFVPFVQEVARYLAPEDERREYTPAMLPAGAPARLGFVDLPSGRRVVVNADVRESDPGRMDAAQFRSAVRTRTARAADAQVAQRRAQAAESGQALWRYGLMLMLAALVAESVVGSKARRA